jgi:Chlorophyll A-B binding protein
LLRDVAKIRNYRYINLQHSSHNLPLGVLAMQTTSTPKTEDRNAWVFGFTPQAEIWNGRLAMIGFIAAIVTEVLTKQGVLHFWGLI